jgi:hypothetical protein
MLFSIGTRAMLIPGVGFQPYSTDELLIQSSLAAGLTFWHARAFSASASFEWDAGGKSAKTRGQNLSLFVHRLSAPIEIRWQPAPRVAFFAKVGLGANRLLASNDGQLRARNWSFGYDESAGVDWVIAKTRRARVWFTAELGYSLAFSAAMNLTTSPGEDDPSRRYGTTALPDLKLGGGLSRIGVAVSF